jgi:hypothetical protein
MKPQNHKSIKKEYKMKTLVGSLVVLVFAFFIGCQNSITDPVVPDQTNYNNTAVEETVAYKDAITEANTWPGLIRLHNVIYDPSHPSLIVKLIGNIRYKIEPGTASGGYTDRKVKVSIFNDIEVRSGCPRQHVTPSVRSFAFANVKISTVDELNYIEKSFIVRNTCCGQLTLVLKFGVRENDIFLVSSTLNPRGGWFPIDYEF